jgi:hypothetical protein
MMLAEKGVDAHIWSYKKRSGRAVPTRYVTFEYPVAIIEHGSGEEN